MKVGVTIATIVTIMMLVSVALHCDVRITYYYAYEVHSHKLAHVWPLKVTYGVVPCGKIGPYSEAIFVS